MRNNTTRANIVALIAVGALLLMFIPVVLAQNAELANRGTCAANVRGIAQSMHIYGADNDDIYPVVTAKSATTYDVSLKPQMGGKTTDLTFQAIFQQGKNANNPLACLWMLAIRGDVAPRQFLCRSDPFANKPGLLGTNTGPQDPDGYAISNSPLWYTGEEGYYLNFQDSKNVSYSVAYPWVLTDNKTVAVGGHWKAMSDASIPTVSDMAPYLGSKPNAGAPATRPAGAPEAAAVDAKWATTTASSQNHQFSGQNVAFGDAHAEYQKTPLVGQNGDSIWGIRKDETKQGGDEIPLEAGTLPHPLNGKQGSYDTVMVPSRDAKGDLK